MKHLPQSAAPKRGRAGRASPPARRARPANYNDRAAMLIAGMVSGWLLLQALLAITEPLQ
jgi:hypothetical protein